MYLQIPVQVVHGKLDHAQAYLQFGRPFVVKHIVHTGIVEDDDLSGPSYAVLNQFQKPLDPDDRIEDKTRWKQAGEQAISNILAYVQE